MIRDDIQDINLNVAEQDGVKAFFITGFFDSESRIPLFTHPISILNIRDINYLCTDLRLFVRKGTSPDDVTTGIRNLTEYNFAKSRAVLNLIWMAGGVGQVKNNLQFAGAVFAAWLSQTIGKAFALDFKDQTVVSIITSIYYQGLFSNATEWTEDDKLKMASHTINATKAPSDLVFSTLDQLTPMATLHDYCLALVKVLENVRLKNFNVAFLLSIISNSWYGTSAKEIISVSLEHPPTWCAMVYTALSQRTYRNSAIFQTAEKVGKRGLADNFVKAYNLTVKESLLAMEDMSAMPTFPLFA